MLNTLANNNISFEEAFIIKFSGLDIPQEVIDIVLQKNDDQGYNFPQIAYWLKQNCEFVK